MERTSNEETKKHRRIKKDLQNSVQLACDWLINSAQVKSHHLTVENDSMKYEYDSWQGAIRSEYGVAEQVWSFFGPIWHTGQAVKALVQSYQILGEEKYLQAAKKGAAFIYDKQIWEEGHPDRGLILAYEDFKQAGTSAILEALDGLIYLAELEKDKDSWERIEAAANFLIDKCYVTGEGVFRDLYDSSSHQAVVPNPFRSKKGVDGRPLLDDSIYLKLFRKTGREKYLNVHLEISNRLIKDQNPKGNWIDYGPCHARQGTFHPRHTYWWGKPFIETYFETKNSIYLETAIASGEFNLQAMRRDGGWIRVTDRQFNTESFGHATSGSAGAAIFFIELYQVTAEKRWLHAAQKALEFCIKMQLTHPSDQNLKGAILEKILPPNGTDQSPYYIRDLGTIFFIQAAVNYMNLTIVE